MANEQEQTFAATYDSTTKIISAVAFAVFVIAYVVTRNALVGGFGFCVLALSYAYSPQSYAVSGATIRIRRLIGTVRFPLEGLRELRAGGAEDFHGCVRLWGSGGLFGYYGYFRTAKLGKCRWYVTSRRNSVIVVADGGTIVLSPSDVSGFVEAVRRVVPVPEGLEKRAGEESERRKAGIPRAGWLGGIGAILVACVVCFSMMYSPGPPGLALSSNSLTIHDRFYPVTVNAADVDVAGIRVVDIRTDAAWEPTARTNGFANGRYHSGWFRVARGPARMYWADGTNLVLLPPRRNGVPVLFQVNDPEQFVQTLRQKWAGDERSTGGA